MGTFKFLTRDDFKVDETNLRAYAREQVVTSPLIQRCALGEVAAIRQLKIGFWPFVYEFEKIIDRRAASLRPRHLFVKFPPIKVARYFREAKKAVMEMHEDEGSHATLWMDDAAALGIVLSNEKPLPNIQELIDKADIGSASEFFCALAGTEFIAEELSSVLVNASQFVGQFPEGRWTWGDAHLVPHTPSHLEIDLDLAAAYHESGDPAVILPDLEQMIRMFSRRFYTASVEVFENIQF